MPFRMSHSSCTKARKRKPGKTDFTLHKYCTVNLPEKLCSHKNKLVIYQIRQLTFVLLNPKIVNCEISTGFFLILILPFIVAKFL